MNRYLRSMPAALLIAFTFALSFTAGCSKDEPQTGAPIPPTIEVSRILCSPLAPAPGDTAQLTVRAEGQGTGATYEWQVEAGTLIGSDEISIRWAVPANPGTYMIMVRASIGSEVRRDTTWVMVRRCEAIDTGLRYVFYPNLIEGEFYAVGTNSSPSGSSFLGYHAYKLEGVPPTLIDRMPGMNVNGGYDFKFYPTGILAASIMAGAEYIRQQAMNVVFYPYAPGAPRKLWSDNEIAGRAYRMNQNLNPSASSNLDMAVWQRLEVGSTDDGRRDLVNIRFRALNQPIQTLTTSKDSVYQSGTWKYIYRRNIKPMFSPNNAMIVYFNDSTGTFEPCLIPMDGADPNLAARRALLVDPRHGIFYRDSVQVSEKTIFQWNPVNPTQLAFIDDRRQLCIFDYAAETVARRGKGFTELVYSEDGKLAAVATDGVYVLEPGQTQARRIFTKELATDALIGINWSPGLVDQKLGFRMLRKGASTLESYSALVIYSRDNDKWYYASPAIKPVVGIEPAVDYTWMRAIFDPSTGGMYVPVPLSEGGGKSKLYYSY